MSNLFHKNVAKVVKGFCCFHIYVGGFHALILFNFFLQRTHALSAKN